jgi:hypothetical protein
MFWRKMDKTLGSVREPHTYKQLAAVLDYNAETGLLTWKEDRSKRVKAGMVAGSKHNKGYITLEYDTVPYLAHRVAWLLHYREWPSHFIDHEDLDRANNRIHNLRLATRAGNSQNHPLRQDNSSGVKGVNWHQKSGKWSARIQVDNQRISLGYYERLEDAKVAVEEARSQLHKEFSNNG